MENIIVNYILCKVIKDLNELINMVSEEKYILNNGAIGNDNVVKIINLANDSIGILYALKKEKNK